MSNNKVRIPEVILINMFEILYVFARPVEWTTRSEENGIRKNFVNEPEKEVPRSEKLILWDFPLEIL